MIQRSIMFAAYAVFATGICMGSGVASAKGCNGVVDQLKWGCAAWDNNNGPQYPHYKGAQKPAQPAAAPVTPPQVQRPALVPNGGAGIVAQGGGNAKQQAQSGIVAQGGGNAKQNTNNLIGHDGASLRR